MSLYLGPNEDVVPTQGQPKIREVRAYVSRSEEYGASDVHDTPDTHWIMGLPDKDGMWDHETTHPPITNPMSRYPQYSGSRGSWGVAKVPTVIVEVEDEKGRIGIGTSTGGEAAAFLIEQHLSMFVEGRNVRDRSLAWRAALPPQRVRCVQPHRSCHAYDLGFRSPPAPHDVVGGRV